MLLNKNFIYGGGGVFIHQMLLWCGIKTEVSECQQKVSYVFEKTTRMRY